MYELVKNIRDQIDALRIQENSLVNEHEILLHKIEDIKKETRYLQEAVDALQSKIKRGQDLIKKSLARKQYDLQQLSEKVSEMELQIRTTRQQISETNKQLNTKNQKIEDILHKERDSLRLTIDFKDGKGLRLLSIEQFRSLSDTVLHAIETQEFANKGRAFYEIGMLIENESLLPLFSRALKGALYYLNHQCITNNFTHEGIKRYTQAYQKYSKNPNQENLINAVKSVIENLKVILQPNCKPCVLFPESMIRNFLEIGEILCPEYARLNKIFCTSKRNNLKNESKSKAVYQFLQELYVWHTLSHSESAFCERYFAVAASYDYQAAVEELARRNKYKSFGVSMKNGKIAPLFCGNGNPQYPTINVGLDYECRGFGQSVRIARTLNFLTAEVSEFNHYVAISYEKNSNGDIETSMNVFRAILTSVTQWCGSNNFELDVVDWDFTGLAGLCTRFQPVEDVRAVTNLNKWPDEIQSLEEFMEKRSLLMSSIFEYNKENVDKALPFRIVAIHDYDGSLIANSNAYAHRFSRLLERGYRFGVIFVICSKRGAYIPNTLTVNCSTKNFEDLALCLQRPANEEANEENVLTKLESKMRELEEQKKQLENQSIQSAYSNCQLRAENQRMENRINELEQHLNAREVYHNPNNDCKISVIFSCSIRRYKTVDFEEKLDDITSFRETTTMRESEFRQLILAGRKAILEFAYAQWPELDPENTAYTIFKTDILLNKSYFNKYENVKLTKIED